MTLHTLDSPSSLSSFLSSNVFALVCFSAKWCGPCKNSHPQLVALAASYRTTVPNLAMGIVYEDSLGEEIHRYAVRAYPTYILFEKSSERARVVGVDFAAIQQMVEKSGAAKPLAWESQGYSLGSSASAAKDIKAARLAHLAVKEDQHSNIALSDPPSTEVVMEAKPSADQKTTAEMEIDQTPMDATPNESMDPVSDLDAAVLQELTTSFGFPLIRAQKGLLYGGNTTEGAVEWLLAHQDDDDIDIPIPLQRQEPAVDDGGAQSYKCNECGKLLSNMANLELHANKTGHSDFSESTESIKPLSEEEKKKKIEEIKSLLAAKRSERLEKEKEDEIERERRRRFEGQEMAKTRDQLEAEQRKREILMRKREKENFKKERERIRRELEKDKMERLANKGKLQSKLGVEGYHPDAIQYEQDVDGLPKKPHPAKPSMSIQQCIEKVSSYRAGGDGEKCLKVLLAYVKNVIENQDDDKYRTINMENKAFKTRVKPFIGGKQLLLGVGFHPEEGGEKLVLPEDSDKTILLQAKELLEKAIANY